MNELFSNIKEAFKAGAIYLFNFASIFAKVFIGLIFLLGALSSALLLYKIFPETFVGLYLLFKPFLFIICRVTWYLLLATAVFVILYFILLIIESLKEISENNRIRRENLMEKRKKELADEIVKRIKLNKKMKNGK